MKTHDSCCSNHSENHSMVGPHNSESIATNHCGCDCHNSSSHVHKHDDGCDCETTHDKTHKCGCVHDEPIPRVDD